MSWTLVQAQDGTFLSKIKLKDGSELNVVILENVPGKYIKIMLPGEQEATIDYKNILSIKHQNYGYKPEYILPKGWHYTGSFGFVFGKASKGGAMNSGIVLGATANYRLKPFFSIGAGIEPTLMFLNDGYLLLPTFIRVGGSFAEKKVVPVYFIDAGWSFAQSNSGQGEAISVDGGWFLRPGIGLRFNDFSILLGYQLQKITTTSEFVNWWGGGDQLITEERLTRNMSLNISYNF
jgi:hypothetical protein